MQPITTPEAPEKTVSPSSQHYKRRKSVHFGGGEALLIDTAMEENIGKPIPKIKLGSSVDSHNTEMPAFLRNRSPPHRQPSVFFTPPPQSTNFAASNTDLNFEQHQSKLVRSVPPLLKTMSVPKFNGLESLMSDISQDKSPIMSMPEQDFEEEQVVKIHDPEDLYLTKQQQNHSFTLELPSKKRSVTSAGIKKPSALSLHLETKADVKETNEWLEQKVAYVKAQTNAEMRQYIFELDRLPMKTSGMRNYFGI